MITVTITDDVLVERLYLFKELIRVETELLKLNLYNDILLHHCDDSWVYQFETYDLQFDSILLEAGSNDFR